MKIKNIISQHRRDYVATMICEHCGHEQLDKGGYDDRNYHVNIIPRIKCNECGEVAPKEYRPLTTKYPEGFVV